MKLPGSPMLPGGYSDEFKVSGCSQFKAHHHLFQLLGLLRKLFCSRSTFLCRTTYIDRKSSQIR